MIVVPSFELLPAANTWLDVLAFVFTVAMYTIFLLNNSLLMNIDLSLFSYMMLLRFFLFCFQIYFSFLYKN